MSRLIAAFGLATLLALVAYVVWYRSTCSQWGPVETLMIPGDNYTVVPVESQQCVQR